MSDLDELCTREGKRNWNCGVTSGINGMQKGSAPGWDERRAVMVNVAGDIGARWKKRNLTIKVTHGTGQK